MDAAAPGQNFFLQLYVNRDREVTRKYVQHAEARGIKGLFITVDAPQLGRREKDMRMKVVGDDAGAEVQKDQKDVKKDQGVARAISVRIESLFWLDIAADTCDSRSLTLVSRGRISHGSKASRRVC